jgi:cellulase/cellobiase CelA1
LFRRFLITKESPLAAKHSVRSSTSSASQFFLTFAAVVLAVLTAWVVVRAAGPGPAYRQPTVVLPSMPQVPIGWSSVSVAPFIPAHGAGAAPSSAGPTSPPAPGTTTTTTTPVPATTAPPDPGTPVPPPPGTANPTSPTGPVTTTPPVPPKTTQPTVKPTPPPTPTRTSAPPAQDTLTVQIDIYSSWEQGYTTGAKLTNNGDDPVSWTVRITHSGQQNLSLVNYWNARGRQSGDTFVFTGNLAPGASVWWGWQAGKTGRGNAHPDGCTLVGGECTMR